MSSELREALNAELRKQRGLPDLMRSSGYESGIEFALRALAAAPAPETLRRIVWRTASMGSCSQTHHEHLAGEARAALALTATNEPESATLAAAPAPEPEPCTCRGSRKVPHPRPADPLRLAEAEARGNVIAMGAMALDVERAREQREAARAAHLFMNMIRCRDCHLPWPEGYIHDGCPALKP